MGLFSKFFGRTVSQSTHGAGRDQAPYIDHSSMTTDIGKNAALRLNEQREAANAQLLREREVLKFFLLYSDAEQLDLAEAAMIWAYAVLASEQPQEECKSNFSAFRDAMYVQLDDAKQTLGDRAREQLFNEARALQQSLNPTINVILDSSTERLSKLNEKHLYRIVAEMLDQTRRIYLDHAPRQDLPALIAHCVILCGKIEMQHIGVECQAAIVDELHEISKIHSSITTAVHEALDSGKLAVVDGRIIAVQPECYDDDDDDDLD